MPYTPNNPLIPGDLYSYDLKWIVSKIEEWMAVYENINKSVEDLNKSFEDLKKYVDDFIDDLDIQVAVDNKLEEMYLDGSLAVLIQTSFLSYNPKLDYNIIAEYYSSTYHYLNGGCYVKNGGVNELFYYESVVGSDTGVLYAIDLDSYGLIGSWNIPAYHGNSMCYREADRSLYLAACYSESDPSTLLDFVVKVPIDSPSSYQYITLPNNETCYSITYDKIADVFFSTPERGNTPGVSNIIYKYNSDLTTNLGSITLKPFPAVELNAAWDSQGVQLVTDDIIWTIFYSPVSIAIGYDSTSGEIKKTLNIPDIISGYKHFTEIEFITQLDNGNILIGGKTKSLAHINCIAFAECSYAVAVPVFMPYIEAEYDPGALIISVDESYTDYRPAYKYTINSVREIYDINTIYEYTGYSINVNLASSSRNYVQKYFPRFNGELISNANRTFVAGIHVIGDYTLLLTNVQITEGAEVYTGYGAAVTAAKGANIILNSGSYASIQNYLLFARDNSRIFIMTTATLTPVSNVYGTVNFGGVIESPIYLPVSHLANGGPGRYLIVDSQAFTPGSPVTINTLPNHCNFYEIEINGSISRLRKTSNNRYYGIIAINNSVAYIVDISISTSQATINAIYQMNFSSGAYGNVTSPVTLSIYAIA